MKRPVEFWATVALALVIVYMIHDAYASRPRALSTIDIKIDDIEVEDARDFEPAGVYTEWQSSIQPHEQYAWEQPQYCILNSSDWPCLDVNGC